MVKKPVTIGTHHFSKKGDAAAFLQAILHKYDVGDKVSALDAEVLRAALALHPDAAAKVGAGSRTSASGARTSARNAFGSIVSMGARKGFHTKPASIVNSNRGQ